MEVLDARHIQLQASMITQLSILIPQMKKGFDPVSGFDPATLKLIACYSAITWWFRTIDHRPHDCNPNTLPRDHNYYCCLEYA